MLRNLAERMNCSGSPKRARSGSGSPKNAAPNKKKPFLGPLLNLLFETIFHCFVLKICIKKQIETQRWLIITNIARKKGHEGST